MDGTLTIENGDEIIDFIDLVGANLSRMEENQIIRIRNWLTPLVRPIQQHNPISKSRQNVAHHYDLSDELFDLFLDSDRQYSCAYFETPNDSLEQAQLAKKHHLLAKLRIDKPSLKLLDIGSGWGGLGIYMHQQTGADVTGLTLSTEQRGYATERVEKLGIANNVRFHLRDYRLEEDKYDRIVSVGMFEHVGRQNYTNYFKIMHSLLVPGGLFLLQTIGARRHVYSVDPWIEKYIFPNGMLPPARAIVDGTDKLFTIEDWHNFGADYDRTLMAWYQNFIDAWPSLSEKYDERFRRMFEYYLLTCAGAFRARENQLWQVVLSAGGTSGGYQSVR